ncbi:pyridoxamine 5'-phosphate oxidase family protein [Dehalococcoidia bacterium]|nr:pyridoxamine 5'-phosphate oxidase family protein [Dehalococcoidia bacterium]
MPVTLDQAEVDDFLTQGHTLIFTTIDKDGYPHSSPLWYVYMDGNIYVRGRANSQKAANIARNANVCGLVETGELWRELKAVMIRGEAVAITDSHELAKFTQKLTDKYAGFRESQENLPKRTQHHYSTSSCHWKIVPRKKVATWDNRKIRLAN